MKKLQAAVLLVIILLGLNYTSNGQASITFFKPKTKSIDTTETLNSLTKTGDYHQLNYKGDYSLLLDWIDGQFTGGNTPGFNRFNCSLFTARGDSISPVSGRNFDNPPCDVLVTKCNPPDANSSLAFTRISDLGYPLGTNYQQLSFQQRLPFLLSCYFAADGLNDKGLFAGLAYVPPVQFTIDPTKDTIFITRLVREILDHATNIDEANAIANSFNVFDAGINTISHHLLVADESGSSYTLEFVGGEFRSIEYSEPWHGLTNTAVYNVPAHQLQNLCWRYNTMYDYLEMKNGNISWMEGMNVLEQVHLGTPWSAIYDHEDNGIFVAINENYENISYIMVDDFSTRNYGAYELVGISLEDENENGVIEENEFVDLTLSITADFDSYGISGELTSTDPSVEILNPLSSFDDIVANQPSPNSSRAFSFKANSLSNPHNATFNLKITTAYGHEFDLHFKIFLGVGDILLIDDDTGADYENYYNSAFEELDIKANHYDIVLRGDVPLTMLQLYPNTVWFTGDASENTLTQSDQELLANYLDSGGNLFLTGQNIGNDIGESDFYADYLHAEHQQNTFPANVMQGINGDPYWGGNSISITGVGGANNQSSPGIILPLNGASKAYFFIPNEDHCSSVYYDGNYKLVYFEFGFEAVSKSSPELLSREELLELILGFFNFHVGIQHSLPPGEDFFYCSPNPFSAGTNIYFELASPAFLSISLHNLMGQHVQQIASEYFGRGQHTINWGLNKRSENIVQPGIYLLVINGSSINKTIKLVYYQ